jgi:oxaloacetate decarboxylase beta subunit
VLESILGGLSGLGSGAAHLFSSPGLPNLVMLLIAAGLLYLGVRKQVEPLLLVPIGFGCLLVNVPLSDLMDQGGVLRTLYDAGIAN